MLAGEARLGTARVAWTTPEAFPDASGGLSFLADGDAPRRVSWTVTKDEPRPIEGRYDAFLGDVRIRIEPEHVQIAGPDASFHVTAAAVEGRVRARPALAAATALHALAAFHGLVHLHAAAVRLDGRTVLAPGGSGAGKTSFALAIARAGGDMGSDDVTYVDAASTAWPLRRPPHVLPDTQRAHPHLVELGPVLDGMIAKSRVESPAPGPAMPSRVDAVVLPRIEAIETTRIEPVEPSRVFALLLGSSAFAMIDGSPMRDVQLDTLAHLAERPAVCLVAGRDALVEPRVLGDVLREWLSGISW